APVACALELPWSSATVGRVCHYGKRGRPADRHPLRQPELLRHGGRIAGALNTRPDLMPLLVRDRPRRDLPLVARRIGEAIALVELRGEDQDHLTSGQVAGAPASVHPPVTPGFLLLLDRRLRYRALLLFPRAEPALLDLVLERLGVDLKEAGRLRAVPVHAVEDLVDGHAFGIPGGPTRDLLETDHLLGVDGRRHRRGGHGWPRAAANEVLPTDAGETAVLQDVQQLGLELQRDLADLVEEERAPIHRLEFAGLLPVGARECALLVTEQLGFEQLVGKRRAIHLQELPMGARRRQVNGPGHDFLADSALT